MAVPEWALLEALTKQAFQRRVEQVGIRKLAKVMRINLLGDEHFLT